MFAVELDPNMRTNPDAATTTPAPPGLETLIRRVHSDTPEDGELSVGYVCVLASTLELFPPR